MQVAAYVFLTVAFGMMMLVASGLVVLIAWATWRSLFTSAWPATRARVRRRLALVACCGGSRSTAATF